MHPFTLITYLDTTEAFDWGWRPERSRAPTIIVAHPRLEADIDARCAGAIEVVFRAAPEAFDFRAALSLVADLHRERRIPTDHALFCEAHLLYKYISFDLVYRGLLQRAVAGEGFLHHNLTDTVRSIGLYFTLTLSEAEGTRARLEQQPELWATGISADRAQWLLPVVERYTEDVNLVAIHEIPARTLHLVGDSHVLLMLTPNRELGTRSHVFVDLSDHGSQAAFDFQFTHHLGSRTMYGFSADGGDHPVSLEAFGVRGGDTVVFVLGEIDVRSHVFKYVAAGRPLPHLIDELTARYFEKICALTDALGVDVAVMGVIPPMDGPNYTSKDYPIRGSLSQRVRATRLLNDVLAAGCRARGFAYFEVNDLYALPDGSLDVGQSDRFCHVGHHFQDEAIARMMACVGGRSVGAMGTYGEYGGSDVER